jgi:hypothetical protein
VDNLTIAALAFTLTFSSPRVPVDSSAVWQNCLALIRDRVAGQTFQTWFVPLKVALLEDSQITLQVPSQFYYEWLDSHYRPLILDAVKQATGKELQLRYSVMMGESENDEIPRRKSLESDTRNGFSRQSPSVTAPKKICLTPWFSMVVLALAKPICCKQLAIKRLRKIPRRAWFM